MICPPCPRANFDEVLVPADHVSRRPNDTYYVTADTVLRCHTSAHQAETLRKGEGSFLVTGDVYRCAGGTGVAGAQTSSGGLNELCAQFPINALAHHVIFVPVPFSVATGVTAISLDSYT